MLSCYHCLRSDDATLLIEFKFLEDFFFFSGNCNIKNKHQAQKTHANKQKNQNTKNSASNTILEISVQVFIIHKEGKSSHVHAVDNMYLAVSS